MESPSTAIALCRALSCSEDSGPQRENDWRVKEEEDTPCSPETLRTHRMKRLMIPDADLVKDLESIIHFS